jgi:hypothetical protein
MIHQNTFKKFKYAKKTSGIFSSWTNWGKTVDLTFDPTRKRWLRSKFSTILHQTFLAISDWFPTKRSQSENSWKHELFSNAEIDAEPITFKLCNVFVRSFNGLRGSDARNRNSRITYVSKCDHQQLYTIVDKQKLVQPTSLRD